MGLSYVQSVYKSIESADKTDPVQIVPEGIRGRLYSLWYIPAGADLAPFTLTVKDGDETGSTIFESDGILVSMVYASRENSPFSFPRNGLLFKNGLNAVMDGPGLLSVTITYSGEG